MILTIALAAVLGGSPGMQTTTHYPGAIRQNIRHTAIPASIISTPSQDKNIAIDLHSMTNEEQKLYPGRERFDKTEWYESQFKSAKIVMQPEHVDEWHNGGLDEA
jgi:hypothetical protein